MDTRVKTKRKRSQRDYTLGFKLSVVEQVEKGDLTYKQAQKVYGIQGRSTVLVWLRKHGKRDWLTPRSLIMTSHKETPAQKIKRLERELDDERCRVLILDGMIDYIDQETGSELRKKHLPKALKAANLKIK